MNPVINPASTPADQARTTSAINVDGVGRVNVSPEFFALPPDQQQQAVNEIRQYNLSQQQGAPAQPGQPAPEPFRQANSMDMALHLLRPATDTLAGAARGGARVMDNAAEYMEGGYNNTLGRLFGETHQVRDLNHPTDGSARQGFQGYTDQLPPGNEFGRTIGEMGVSALLTRGRAPFMGGAMQGGLTSNSDTPLGIAGDMLAGGIGGSVTNRLVGGISNMVAPQVSQAAQALHARGIPMTPGQVIPALRRWEERQTSRPFVGDRIVEGRQNSYREFNRAAINEVVAPYNAAAPHNAVRVPTGDPGHSMIRFVGDQLSERYENLVPRLTLRPDQQLGADIQALRTTLTNGDLSPAAQDQFEAIVRNQVMPRLNGAQPLTGEAYRGIERNLGAQIRRYSRSTNPDDQAMATAFEEMQQAFQSALQRSNPAHAAELGALNQSWSNLVRVEGAASGAGTREGLFSPAQFRAAVRRGDDSTRHRGMARGEAPMQDLAEAAVDVLPSQYPDSGTSGRTQDNPMDARYWLGLAQSRLYSPEVQQFISRAALAPRPPAAQTISDLLRALPASQIGAAGGMSLISPFVSAVPPGGQ